MAVLTERTNPFPVEAVATFGRLPLASYENLNYFERVEEELQIYLSSYVDPRLRYGGAIGLSGSHGAGKTHLLGWIAQLAVARRKVEPLIAYAKADSDSFFDLYTALAAAINLECFRNLIQVALRQIAIRYVSRARATESIASRLENAESLDQLYREQNLDEVALRHMLEKELAATDLSEEIRRAILLLDSAQVGDKAYQWLLGRQVEGLSELGLPYQLSDIAKQPKYSAIPETLALDALEIIATLCAIAEVPLVFLIDQMEMLFDTPQARLGTSHSLIKKLFEQVGSRNALVFIAGTGDAWTRVRRDVGPRLRTRDPIEIGRLDTAETTALLAAYTGKEPSFSASSVETIWRLSGGNPREILSISYHAFRITAGGLANITDDQIIQSAQRSGSLRDRQRIALQIVDAVLGAQGGRLYQNLVTDEAQGTKVDRVLQIGDHPVLLVKMLAAADRVAETILSRDVTKLTVLALKRWPAVHMVVASVGYASDQVVRLIGSPDRVSVLEFDEADFEGRLESIVMSVLTKDSSSGASSTEIGDLSKVDSQLEDIQKKREAGDQQILDRAVENLGSAASPVLQERERKTRREIIEILDDLLHRIPVGDLNSERSIIRSVLITNEAYVKNTLFERLGDVYLDLISTARMVDSRGRIWLECREMRESLTQQMIDTLRGRFLADKISALPFWKASLWILGVAFCLWGIWALVNTVYYVGVYPATTFTPVLFRFLVRDALVFALGSIPLLYVYFVLQFSTRRWERSAKRLRSDGMEEIRQAAAKEATSL